MFVRECQQVICELALDRCCFLASLLFLSTMYQVYTTVSSAVPHCKIGKFPVLSLKMSPTENERHKSLCMSGTNVPTVSHQFEFFTTWKKSGRPVDTFQPGSYC